MKNVKVPVSDSYHDYLIKSLQDPEEAAAYLEAILEEEDPEPELLKVALLDVAEALGQAEDASEKRKFYSKKLDEILSQSGSQEVYALTNWLNSFGLKLTVAIADQEHQQMKLRYSIFIQWSNEDQKYIASLPEFGPYAHTHGDSYEEVTQNAQNVLELLIETHPEQGKLLLHPAPFQHT